MASVFLSYVREDAEKARSLAAILERFGHSVWWDRQIKGGAQFSAEIEAALDAAEKVIVLWSAQSVQSAWVRDEAAAGRDSGRLIPVQLDSTPPPLGFRQFQAIDLSRWNGRSNAPALKDLQDALASAARDNATPQRKPAARKLYLSRRTLIRAVSLLAVAALAALAWQFWPGSVPATPTFSVVAADGSASSRQLATEVATRTAGLGDSSGADFHVVDANAATGGKNYVLKVAAAGTAQPRSSLTLVSNDDAIIWSTTLEAASDAAAHFPQAVAITGQRALSCTADALSFRREKLDQATLKTYVQGCTQYDGAYGSNVSNAALSKLFKDVVAKAPHFAAAWGKLFAVESEDMVAPDTDALRKTVQEQLKRVDELGIDVAESYAVKANLVSPDDFIGIFRVFDEGIAKHPDNAFLYRLRGERYSFVGRMNDAVGDTGQAVQLDPLSPANQQTFASELAYSGNVAAAYAQLRKAEQLWPDSLTVGMARYRMDLRLGDPREALALYQKYALEVAGNPAAALFIQARINPTPANIEAALEAERKTNRQFPPFIASLIQSLAHFGRKDEAIDLLVNYPSGKFAPWIGYNSEVLFRPYMRDVWRDPRSIAGAAHVGLLRYWKASGKWPDFCFDPTLPYDCKEEAAKYPRA